MPLGTDTLRFGGGLSFLQAIYLGMCFTGGPGYWVQTLGLCSLVCCTSLGLNQVSHVMGCWEPIIWEVLLFPSLLFLWPVEQWQSKASWTHHDGWANCWSPDFCLGPCVGSGVTLGAGGSYLAPLALKPASEISLFEGVNESARYFLPTGRGKSSAHVWINNWKWLLTVQEVQSIWN